MITEFRTEIEVKYTYLAQTFHETASALLKTGPGSIIDTSNLGSTATQLQSIKNILQLSPIYRLIHD